MSAAGACARSRAPLGGNAAEAAMTNILLVYETRAGQTRKIAEFVADHVRTVGNAVEIVDLGAKETESLVTVPDGIIVLSPVHGGRHSERVHAFVERHLDLLHAVPSAFISIGLAAMNRASKEALAQLNSFLEETGWQSTVARPVAGALAYRRYSGALRLLMRIIASRRGLPTDTSRDYEYTDWDDVRQFVGGFLRRVRAAEHRRAVARSA
jgi:menaquinone-dependent protoporphyrinogen oxidase